MVTINGNTTALSVPTTVAAYLAENHYKPEQIAVELNEEILEKDRYKDTVLKDGDVMEIVQFMGGGR